MGAKTVGKRKGYMIKSEHFLGNPEYLDNFPLSFGKSLPSSSSPEQHVVLCSFVQPRRLNLLKSPPCPHVCTLGWVVLHRSERPTQCQHILRRLRPWAGEFQGCTWSIGFPQHKKSIRNDRVVLQLGVHLVLCTLLFPSFFLSVCSRS